MSETAVLDPGAARFPLPIYHTTRKPQVAAKCALFSSTEPDFISGAASSSVYGLRCREVRDFWGDVEMRDFSKTLLAAGALALVSASAAQAADSIVDESPNFDVRWAGYYAGAQVGYSWGDTDTFSYRSSGSEAFRITGFNVDGFAGGAFLGRNWRASNNLVFGIEAEANLLSADDRIYVASPGYGAEVFQNWDASLRARLGMDMGDFMPYLTAGLAAAGVETFGWTDWGSSDFNRETLVGWTIGAGVEKQFGENLRARLQYRYSDYGDATWALDPNNDPETGRVQHTSHMLTVGIIRQSRH
jgi:outer membrane immunogenic protein